MLGPRGSWLSHGAPRTPHGGSLQNPIPTPPTPKQHTHPRPDASTEIRLTAETKIIITLLNFCGLLIPALSFDCLLLGFFKRRGATSPCFSVVFDSKQDMTETREDVTSYQDGGLEHMLVLLHCMCTSKLSHQMPSAFKLRGVELIMPCARLWLSKSIQMENLRMLDVADAHVLSCLN